MPSCFKLDLQTAARLLPRAVLSDGASKEAKIPIMATTTKSSIKVNFLRISKASSFQLNHDYGENKENDKRLKKKSFFIFVSGSADLKSAPYCGLRKSWEPRIAMR
ncbi:hypothetical protein LNTAR_07014 [Lentisphaera araneosa HTCC2155]|uniref:Uncharacterized protein n=1 Tax=Lentisphaera araneosa HTCC2155 TaxID=313628 RepID=A6DMT8_9BACT|nr:hypothetical protein LNTAR_07014 [Lentisphaera araneosa HTCC2155]